MANYKEEAVKSREEFLTSLKHQIVLDLIGAGLTSTEIAKVIGVSKQLVNYIKSKTKVETKLSEPNKKENG